jgi:hypothetical protein
MSRCRIYRKHCLQQFLYCCMLIRCCEDGFVYHRYPVMALVYWRISRSLASNGSTRYSMYAYMHVNYYLVNTIALLLCFDFSRYAYQIHFHTKRYTCQTYFHIIYNVGNTKTYEEQEASLVQQC